MKSLAERKKQRKESRAEALADMPNQDTGIVQDGEVEPDKYDGMTVEQLRAAATELGTEVPKDKTVKADILEFVKNLAAFKATADAENDESEKNTGASWKAGN
jgi:hypothetical protein